jgi:HEAT repeat protein
VKAGRIAVIAIIVSGGLRGASPAICWLDSRAGATGRRGFVEAAQVRPFEDAVRELESENPSTRRKAMRELARVGHPDAIGPIAGLVADPINDIQLEAIETLLDFYLLDIPAKTRRVAGVIEVGRGSRAEEAFELGPFVVLPRPVPEALKEGLARAIRDEEKRIQLEATYALGAIVPPPAGDIAEAALARNLTDKDTNVRLAAARVAGAVRARSAADALIAAINDAVPAVKLAAMRAVGDLREPRAVQALREQLDYYKGGMYARAAIDGLARIADPSSAADLQARLGNADSELRRSAVEGLARMEDPALRALVARAPAKERSKAVRLARAFAAERTGGQGLEVLAEALGDDRLQELAMGYLVELGPGVIPRVSVLLKSPEPQLRERAVQVIGMLGGPDARVALEPTVRDADVAVARAAERALARIRLQAGGAEP